MAQTVLIQPPLRAGGKEPNFLQRFGHAFAHGDIFTKLSFVIWGLGYIGHGQLIKALLVTLVQGLGLYYLAVAGVPNLAKFGTLGTVQMEMVFNPITLKKRGQRLRQLLRHPAAQRHRHGGHRGHAGCGDGGGDVQFPPAADPRRRQKDQ